MFPYTPDRKEKLPSSRDQRSILTEVEINELVLWIQASNDSFCGRTRKDIRLKILQILTARKAAIGKSYSTGRHLLELTSAEKNIVDTSSGPNDAWFVQFYAKQDKLISEKAPTVVDSKRHKGSREYLVQKHFYGEFGLSNELIAAGIMDPLTGILDPVRLINIDESPEQLDVSIGKNKAKVGAGCDASCVITNNEDKTSYTEALTFGADGFQYGPQIIFTGKEYNTSFYEPSKW